MKITIFFSLLLVAFVSARKVTECELAKALLAKGNSRSNIPIEICAAKKSSNLETNSVSEPDEDGERGHGLFHITDEQWCKNGDKDSIDICDMSCDALKDDNLDDDAECMARRQDRNRIRSLKHYKECEDATADSAIGQCDW